MKRAKQQGFSIIEVIATMSMVVILLLLVAKTLSLVERAPMSSYTRQEASQKAQEAIEALSLIKNDIFTCQCSVDSCTGTTCTRSGDGQSCELSPSYTSCWTEYPENQPGVNEFKIAPVGSNWQLTASPGADDVIRSHPYLGRRILIEDAQRDAGGELDPTGTPDSDSKLITVTVNYDNHGHQAQVAYQVLLTAWENL